jgi:HEAT repeat protein
MTRSTVLRAALLLATLVVGSAGCGGAEKKPVADLIQDLKDKDEAVRIKAARDLGRHKPEAAKEAVPALGDALRDKSANVRAAAAKALGAIGPEAGAAAPALKKALKDSDEGVRRAAAQALEAVGGK